MFRTRLSAFAAPVLLLTAGVFAGPLNMQHVSRDAMWLVHLDVESFMASKVGSCLLENHDELSIEGLQEIKQALGVDVLKDVLAITLYGGGKDDSSVALDVGVDGEEVRVGAEAAAVKDAVLVAVMTDPADTMIERFKSDDSYAEVRKDGVVLHSFVEPQSGERHHVYIQQGAAPTQRIVVAGPLIERVVDTAKVVRGDAPSLEGSGEPLAAARPHAGSFIFASALDIAGIHGHDPASRILDQSKQVTFDIGEHADKSFGRLTVATETDQDALNIAQIMQGMVALGRMAIAKEQDAEPVLELLNAVKMEATGNTFAATLVLPADRCCGIIRKAAEEHHRLHENLHNGAAEADEHDHHDDGHGDADEHHHHPHPHHH